MLQNMNKFVKAIIMFVIGCVVMLAATWLVSLVKGTEFQINWIYFLGMGLLIAVLDAVFPAEQRKKNRENLKNSFKR